MREIGLKPFEIIRQNSERKKSPLKLSGLFLNIDPATSYFPTIENCSIIGSNRLNFRVRDGNGCDPVDKITGKLVVWAA